MFLKLKKIGDKVTLEGWVRNNRDQKEFGFIDFYDGTSINTIQIVYDKELSNILNTYDRVIININDSLKYESSFQSKKVYKVTSFFELLDLRDTIDKPIIYQKINNIKSEFYVQDSDAIYKYTMKESDFY